MNKIILVILAALTLSGCDTNTRDHEKTFAWAKEFCGEEGIASFYTYNTIPDTVYCNNGSSANIPVK